MLFPLYSCDICSKIYGSESNLRRHLRNFHKTGPLMKPRPPKTDSELVGPSQPVKTETTVKTEVSESAECIKTEKSEAGEVSGTSGLKTCPHCPFTTYDQSHLTVHVRKHTGNCSGSCLVPV